MQSIEQLAIQNNVCPKLLKDNTDSIILLVEKAMASGEKFTPVLVELCTKYWFEYLEKYSTNLFKNKDGCFDKLCIKVLMILSLQKNSKANT